MESVIGVITPALDPSGRILKLFNGPHWPLGDLLQAAYDAVNATFQLAPIAASCLRNVQLRKAAASARATS